MSNIKKCVLTTSLGYYGARDYYDRRKRSRSREEDDYIDDRERDERKKKDFMKSARMGKVGAGLV